MNIFLSIVKLIICFLLLLFNVLHLSAQKEEEKKTRGKIKAYEKVITGDFTSQPGMFTVHTSDDKLYFEIPDSMFMREFLMASRIARVSNADKDKGYAGALRRAPVLFQFSHDAKNVYLLVPNIREAVNKESKAVKNAFERNYLAPVLATFPIKAVGPDSALLIDVTDFFAKELPLVTPFASKGKPGKFDKESSFLAKVQVFKKNIELQSYFNYKTNTVPFRTLVNRSLVLLDKEPMMPRLSDRRMNYFSVSKTFFGDISSGAASRKESYIQRYRLTPKNEDIQDF